MQPKIILQSLHTGDPEAFYQVASDPDVVQFFDQFRNLTKEEVLEKFATINDDPAYCQYWGIYADDNTFIGFIALKKSRSIHSALEFEKMRQPGYEPDMDALAEEVDKPKLTEARKKALAPYAIDIALSKDFRSRGYAQAAFQEVINYCRKAGIDQVYFEVHPDNHQSLKFLETIGAELLIPTEINFGPSIFKLTITNEAPSRGEILARLKELSDKPERDGYNDWRAVIEQVPDLIPHEELLTDLFTAIHANGVRVEFCKTREDCHFDQVWGDKVVTVGTAKRAEPLSLIWSIAHEYGHTCQKYPTTNEKITFSQAKYERERDAWCRAEKWLRGTIFYRYQWPLFMRIQQQRLLKYLA